MFWQSPRTRKQARPNVARPTARASGIVEPEILVDYRERYGYRLTGQQARTVKRALPCGDYAVTIDAVVVAAEKRKSLPDLVSSLTNGTLRYALGELSALPRAAVVVEDRYSQVFKLDRIRLAVVTDGLAELQVRWPDVPIVFCETRQLAEEWTYRYLAAAHAWASTETAAITRIGAAEARLTLAVSDPLEASAREATCLGPRQRTHRARPRPTPTRDPASPARHQHVMTASNPNGGLNRSLQHPLLM